MSRQAENPKYLAAVLVAGLGLIVAWVLPGFLSPTMHSLWNSMMASAVTGAFGVVAVGRIWPGLPFRKIHLYGLSMAAYGLAIGFVANL